ncbi:hypothetical protein ACQKLX_21175 [Bosea sp. NPDC003192]|uniref:hypothetical protein n=1 Tax=Bosea sp. NPDC003192 TaxID=3390551 RepID=UPI003CFDF46E
MPSLDEDIAWFKFLLEADRFAEGDYFDRVPAIASLIGLCGLPGRRLSSLKRRDFDLEPGTAHLNLVEPAWQARRIPIVETARIVLQQQWRRAPNQKAEAAFLQNVSGGKMGGQQIFQHFRDASRLLGRPDVTVGYLHGLYIRLVEIQRTPSNGRAIAQLCGRVIDLVPGSEHRSPDVAELRRLLEAALPLAKPWRLLTHRVVRRGQADTAENNLRFSWLGLKD